MSTAVGTKVISVLMPLDLIEALETEARKHERTLSQEIRLVLKAHVAEPKRKAS